MSEKLITESIVQHSTVLESLDKDIIGKAAQLIVESIHNNTQQGCFSFRSSLKAIFLIMLCCLLPAVVKECKFFL